MATSIALVGIGGYGNFYLKALLNAAPEREITLMAGIDPYPERSGLYAELQERGIPVYPDLHTFYQHTCADLVIISAPIHLHAPLTSLALSKGSHVLCEKPLGASVEDARLMLEAEQRAGKPVAIGYQWSYSDAILALKRDILAGRFGKPLHLKSMALWPRGLSYYQRNDWAARLKTPDGAWVLDSPVNNATAHYLHNMLFLLGDRMETSAVPLSLEAELYRANAIENYDTAAMRVVTAACPDLLFITAHPVNSYRGPVMHYAFENAVIEYPAEEGGFRATFKDGTVQEYGNPEDTHANKIWAAVESARNGVPLVCGIRTAIPQLACALAAQETEIHTFPPERVEVMDTGSDQLTYVPGLFEDLVTAYEANKMPSEMGMAWAKSAGKVEVGEMGLMEG